MVAFSQSRRSLLFDVLASSPAGTSNLPKAVKGGVRLIAHDDDEFEPHVSSVYPQIANAELYPQAKKFMAVLRHDGTSLAKSYSVLWVLQQGPGRQRTMRAMYIHKHAMLKVGVRKLQPGSARLVSPFFNYSESDYSAHPATASLTIPRNFPFLDAELVSVSIDAVIYADGTVAGPDAHDLRSEHLATRYAEHDGGLSVLAHLRKFEKAATDPLQAMATVPAQIDDLLKKQIEIGAPRQGLKLGDRYLRARAQESAIMQGVLSSGGLVALKQDAARRIRFSKDQLTSVG